MQAVENLAKILYYTDWPNASQDDWKNRKPTDHAKIRYKKLAEAALQFMKDVENE